jgi:hypothetical protein
VKEGHREMSANYNKFDRRVKTVEEAVLLLKELVLKADERADGVDDRMNGFEAALTNLTVKLEALADAQIRTEESMIRLAEAQAHTDQRLDALIDFVRENRNRQ